MSRELNLSMRLCSQFEGAFAHVVMTLLTPAWNLLVDCGATSDFMSMQTANRARLPLYKLS